MLEPAANWTGAVPLALVLLALAADGLVGCLPGIGAALGMPLAVVRSLTRWADEKLNRRRRGTGALRIRGMLVVVVLIAAAWTAGAALSQLVKQLPYGWMIEVLLVLALLRQHHAVACARQVVRAIAAEKEKTGEARAAVGPLVRYDAGALDGFGIARATIEGSVVRFTEGYIGSVFWYLMLGLPALCAYRVVTAAADVIGRPSRRHAAFGFTTARLGDVLTLPAAMIAGPVLALAAVFVPRTRPLAALAGWARDLAQRGIRGPFRAEGAMAGALDIAIGGPRSFEGETLPGPWIGDGRARATVADVRRAVLLITVACLLVALLIALALVVPAR